MTQEDVRGLLRIEIPPRGLREWCRTHGVLHTHACSFLGGKRDAPSDVLAVLGLEYQIMRKPRPALTHP